MMQTPILPEMDELWQQTIAWKPSPEQQRQFQRLYEAVLEGNRQLNLTRITEPQEFWEKHLWDSLRGIRDMLQVNSPQRAIDIGTGAGFPGIPIAIAQPTWTVTLLDSTRKKIAFVDRLLEELEMKTATALVGRVEQVGHDPAHRQQYDLALIRAVATANVCAEYALPLLKLGGVAVLYRGQWTSEETAALQPAVEALGGTIEGIEAFTTPLTDGDRHCLYVRKVQPTPEEYPRAIGIPAQYPLT